MNGCIFWLLKKFKMFFCKSKGFFSKHKYTLNSLLMQTKYYHCFRKFTNSLYHTLFCSPNINLSIFSDNLKWYHVIMKSHECQCAGTFGKTPQINLHSKKKKSHIFQIDYWFLLIERINKHTLLKIKNESIPIWVTFSSFPSEKTPPSHLKMIILY